MILLGKVRGEYIGFHTSMRYNVKYGLKCNGLRHQTKAFQSEIDVHIRRTKQNKNYSLHKI